MTKKEAMQIQDAMDKLAVALASHNHKWNKAEHREYDKAQRVLCLKTERPTWSRVSEVATITKLDAFESLLKQEIKWCGINKCTGTIGRDFKNGFLAGLKQASKLLIDSKRAPSNLISKVNV